MQWMGGKFCGQFGDEKDFMRAQTGAIVGFWGSGAPLIYVYGPRHATGPSPGQEGRRGGATATQVCRHKRPNRYVFRPTSLSSRLSAVAPVFGFGAHSMAADVAPSLCPLCSDIKACKESLSPAKVLHVLALMPGVRLSVTTKPVEECTFGRFCFCSLAVYQIQRQLD